MVRRFVVFVAVLIGLMGIAIAQESWSDRTRAGEWAFSRGDDDRAEAEFRAALEIAQRLPEGDVRLETSLENLGLFFEHRMRMDEAQPMYQLLLAAQEHRLGESHPALLGTLMAVSRASIPTGDTPTAEASLQRYVEIADATGVADPAQHWRALSMFSRIESLQEGHEKALVLQQSAVSVLATDPGATELERAAELETLAQMEILHGDAEGVEALLHEAVELRRADGAGGAAELYAGAASTALGAGEFELAERMATTSLEMTVEGEPKPVTAYRVLADAAWLRVRRGTDQMSDLTAVDGDREALTEAAARQEALLRLQDTTWASDDPERSEVLSRLAKIAAMNGDLTSAGQWQREYVDALPGGSETQVFQAHDGLAFLLTESLQWQEALEVNSELLAELEQAWGTDDARLAPVINRQMLLLTELGRKKEAKAFRKRLRKLTT